jgi:hypothetical protein
MNIAKLFAGRELNCSALPVLCNRTQKFKVNGTILEYKQVSVGFPQESILGPLLFNQFINEFFQLMLPGVELFLYADNTAIIFSAPDNEILQHNATDFFVQYVHWCAANCIVVNSTKSYYLLLNDTDAVILIDGKFIE